MHVSAYQMTSLDGGGCEYMHCSEQTCEYQQILALYVWAVAFANYGHIWDFPHLFAFAQPWLE